MALTASEHRMPGCSTLLAMSAASSAVSGNAIVYRHGSGAVSARSHSTPNASANTKPSSRSSIDASTAGSSGGRKGAMPHTRRWASVSSCPKSSSRHASA